MRIYTRTGDSGMTSLYGGERLPKSDPIFEVLGNLDELNSILGVLVATSKFTIDAEQEIVQIQRELFLLGSYLADKKNYAPILNDFSGISKFQEFEAKTIKLEKLIDDVSLQLPELKNFILPGGSQGASFCHLARSVCRRTERHLVQFKELKKISALVFVCKYLNRLSDFLFQLSRLLNKDLGFTDKIWKL